MKLVVKRLPPSRKGFVVFMKTRLLHFIKEISHVSPGLRAAVGIILLVLAAFLRFAAQAVTGFAEWYAASVYPWIVGLLGRICGIFPFSVAEIGMYLLIIGGMSYIALHIRQWKDIASALILLLGVLAFSYMANCGVNYYRRPFSSYLDLEIRDSSEEELKELCAYLVGKVNETVPGKSRWEGSDDTVGDTAGDLAWQAREGCL